MKELPGQVPFCRLWTQAPSSPGPAFPNALMNPPWNMLSLEVGLRSPGPPAPLPAVFCPPGVPFGPVHFTNYPLKSEYKEYTPEKILKLNPLACIQSAIRYNQKGPWIFSIPKLFRGKFNYLPAYDLPMEPPMTPKPMPASAHDLPTNHSGKLFGIVYIILTGAIDTIILAAGPWSWVGKSASYLLKLAPLLWWALPAKTWPELPLETAGWPPKTGSLTVEPQVPAREYSCYSPVEKKTKKVPLWQQKHARQGQLSTTPGYHRSDS
ncbi:hypothetical protein DSO57_1022996 [Entomophthora muscae]|uniref:Uncharacterized protein n=1 Tax=Entomophthora muscae TaxID=34485 RepID=A0ACC2U147_9FUNG|nr:hypothetical protein DSO57_1022996 [Entomophthora muscae]